MCLSGEWVCRSKKRRGQAQAKLVRVSQSSFASVHQQLPAQFFCLDGTFPETFSPASDGGIPCTLVVHGRRHESAISPWRCRWGPPPEGAVNNPARLKQPPAQNTIQPTWHSFPGRMLVTANDIRGSQRRRRQDSETARRGMAEPLRINPYIPLH